MKRIIGIILAAALVLCFAACKKISGPDPKTDPTQEASAPTEVPTEVPTEAPTEAPTDEPAPASSPDREEAAKLISFFELADEDGVKNGEKLFARYDPADPDTWVIGNNERSVSWNEEGKITRISFDDLYGDLDSTELSACWISVIFRNLRDSKQVHRSRLRTFRS
ncbi:MAG: PT domain-containing protein [Clostridiales bacterium]|nr:PT domain-containing protein [Clostridiales bacterium]